MSDSRILVVLPTLGERLDTLAETLESIDTQREQVSLTLAVIVPPSAVGARDLASAHGAVIVDDPAVGISAAINAGLAVRTTEEFYAWIGDDDLFRPDGLRRLQGLMDADDRNVLAFGGCDYIDPRGTTLWVSNYGALARVLLPWGPDLIPHPGTMIRLDDLQAVGGFDTSLKYAMDLDAFLSLRSRGRFVSTKEAVSAFRWHPDSLTVANRKKSSLESEAVKTRHLPRAIRPLSPIWNLPVRWASALAARRVGSKVR